MEKRSLNCFTVSTGELYKREVTTSDHDIQKNQMIQTEKDSLRSNSFKELDRLRKLHLPFLLQELETNDSRNIKETELGLNNSDYDHHHDDDNDDDEEYDLSNVVPMKKLEDDLLATLGPEDKIDFLRRKYFPHDNECEELGSKYLQYLEEENDSGSIIFHSNDDNHVIGSSFGLKHCSSETELCTISNFSEACSAMSSDSYVLQNETETLNKTPDKTPNKKRRAGLAHANYFTLTLLEQI